MQRSANAIWAMVIATTFFWGSNFNAASHLAGTLPPLSAAAGRFGIAVLVLMAMRAWQAKAESVLSRRDMLALAGLGLVGVFGFNYAFFAALHTTSALNAALIMSLSPLLTTLLSAWLLGTSVTPRQLIGIGIAFAGVMLVITGGHLSAVQVAAGDVWMLVACLLWCLYSVLMRKYAGHVPPLQQARWTIVCGAAALLALALLREQPLQLMTQQTTATWLLLVYMALCGTVLAYLFWLRGVAQLGPQRTAIAFNLVPVFTLLVNLLLGHWPQPEQFAGLVLVLAGVLIASGWRPSLLSPLKPVSAPVLAPNKTCNEA